MLVEISDRHKLLYSKPRLRIRTSQSVAKDGQFTELKTSFRLEGFQSSLSQRDGIPPIPHPFVCCQSGSSTQTLPLRRPCRGFSGHRRRSRFAELHDCQVVDQFIQDR